MLKRKKDTSKTESSPSRVNIEEVKYDTYPCNKCGLWIHRNFWVKSSGKHYNCVVDPA